MVDFQFIRRLKRNNRWFSTFLIDGDYFCIPENQDMNLIEFTDYWDTLERRRLNECRRETAASVFDTLLGGKEYPRELGSLASNLVEGLLSMWSVRGAIHNSIIDYCLSDKSYCNNDRDIQRYAEEIYDFFVDNKLDCNIAKKDIHNTIYTLAEGKTKSLAFPYFLLFVCLNKLYFNTQDMGLIDVDDIGNIKSAMDIFPYTTQNDEIGQMEKMCGGNPFPVMMDLINGLINKQEMTFYEAGRKRTLIYKMYVITMRAIMPIEPDDEIPINADASCYLRDAYMDHITYDNLYDFYCDVQILKNTLASEKNWEPKTLGNNKRRRESPLNVAKDMMGLERKVPRKKVEKTVLGYIEGIYKKLGEDFDELKKALKELPQSVSDYNLILMLGMRDRLHEDHALLPDIYEQLCMVVAAEFEMRSSEAGVKLSEAICCLQSFVSSYANDYIGRLKNSGYHFQEMIYLHGFLGEPINEEIQNNEMIRGRVVPWMSLLISYLYLWERWTYPPMTKYDQGAGSRIYETPDEKKVSRNTDTISDLMGCGTTPEDYKAFKKNPPKWE